MTVTSSSNTYPSVNFNKVYDNSVFCIKTGMAMWATTLFYSTIHELGHFTAAKMCGFPVSAITIGSPVCQKLCDRLGISQSFSVKGPKQLDICFGGFWPAGSITSTRPSQGYRIRTVFFLAAGPLVSGLAAGTISYYTLMNLEKTRIENIHPFLLGFVLANFLGVGAGIANLNPISKGCDGYHIARTILGRS